MIGLTYSTDHYNEFKKTGNKAIFEQVVDKVVSDFLPNEVKEAIDKLPLSSKRTNILSFLDKDRSLFLSIKALLNHQDFSREYHIKDVIRMLSEYVKVGEVEKKKFGEVMTPLELVKEMLATLPEEVWSNPNLKWLDPANGTGAYPAVVIYKLMKGLKEWEPNEKKRYKHIVENMIYVSELQPKNMFLWLCLVDPHDEYDCNVYTGSFLDSGFDKHMKEVWGVEKFDIVMGNPPFNENNSNSNEKIYYKFINKSYILLKNLGILCYVLPDDSISYIVNFEKYQIYYINSDNLVNRYFKGIGTKILYFLSKKEIPYRNTIFIDDKNESSVDITKLSAILMNMEDSLIVDKIYKYSDTKFLYNFAKFNNNNYRIRFNSISKTSFNLRGINMVCVDNKLLKRHNLTPIDFDRNIFKYKVIDHSSDRVEFYADKNFDNIHKRVCINTIGKIKPIYDKNGEYLLTDSFVYYSVENDSSAISLISILNSNISIYLQTVLTHNTKNKFKILNFLPKIDLDREWTNQELYKTFGLSKSEIEIIESKILTIKN